MKRSWQIWLLLVFYGVALYQNFGPGAAVTQPRMGLYFAGSKIEDKQALGGFGRSNNYPQKCADDSLGEEGKLSLIAYPDRTHSIGSHQGMLLRLVNRTNDTVAFEACDSLLYLVQEAMDKNGQWRAIETYPDSWCGNSFHRVFLEPDEYWEFPAPRYSGWFQTKIRFKLAGGGPVLYSNEFEGFVNPRQFVK